VNKKDTRNRDEKVAKKKNEKSVENVTEHVEGTATNYSLINVYHLSVSLYNFLFF